MVSRILLRRHATVAAALATAVVAVLVPAAVTAAPELDRRELVRELQAAYADELRVWGLLNKRPPRIDTARIFLMRSHARLSEIRKDSSLPTSFKKAVNDAREADVDVLVELLAPNPSKAKEFIEKALQAKARALGALIPPRGSGAPQCADGRDNDGDGTRDAPYDSGCTNAKDGSEGSPLTCSLGYEARGGLYVVQGTCSGPFFKLVISARPGAKFDTKRPLAASHARVCDFLLRKVDCIMGDGAANPRHAVSARWHEIGVVPAARPLTVTTIDFGGARRTWVLSPEPAPPPAEPPFSLGPSPVAAVITYTNGTGGCPVVTSFVIDAQFFAPGKGTLTITDGTGRSVSGPINHDGSFDLRSANESYKGKITGSTATGTYTYTTASGCTETYNFSAVLQR